MNLTVQFVLWVLGMVLTYFSESVKESQTVDIWEELRSIVFLIGVLTSLHFAMSISQELGFSIPLAALASGGVSMLLIFIRHELSDKSHLDDLL